MPFVRECILTTLDTGGNVHAAPMGIHEYEAHLVILPFKPSITLDNLESQGTATLNYTDDVRVYAGCLTGHNDWPTRTTKIIQGERLANCISHTEVEVIQKTNDQVRPKYFCKVVHEAIHAPFHGYNRAQFAVIELAILVSRLHMLDIERINHEIDYLKPKIEKTAGPREREAWNWLMLKVSGFHKSQEGES